jgi:hypothetical protein
MNFPVYSQKDLWINKKEAEGLPDLGMVFLDRMFEVAHDPDEIRRFACEHISCDQFSCAVVKQKLQTTDFPR